MTLEYKKTVFKKSMQNKNTINSINGLINWNEKINLIPSTDALNIRNERAKELNLGKKETYFKLG